jgi:hypothetical protein
MKKRFRRAPSIYFIFPFQDTLPHPSILVAIPMRLRTGCVSLMGDSRSPLVSCVGSLLIDDERAPLEPGQLRSLCKKLLEDRGQIKYSLPWDRNY